MKFVLLIVISKNNEFQFDFAIFIFWKRPSNQIKSGIIELYILFFKLQH